MALRTAQEQTGDSDARAATRSERRRGRVTQAAVRAKCLDCLGGRKWDCEMGEEQCALYPWQPWRGRPMPSR